MKRSLITSSKNRTKKKRESILNKKTISTFFIGLLSGLIITILTSFFLNIFPIDKPFLRDLTYIPGPPIGLGERINPDGSVTFHLKHKATFMNYSLIPGSIKNVEFKSVGLRETPKVKLISFDRSKIYFLQKKEIKFEFIITTPISNKTRRVIFYFDIYDNTDRFISQQGIEIELGPIKL